MCKKTLMVYVVGFVNIVFAAYGCLLLYGEKSNYECLIYISTNILLKLRFAFLF